VDTDLKLRKRVTQELEWDPAIDSTRLSRPGRRRGRRGEPPRPKPSRRRRDRRGVVTPDGVVERQYQRDAVHLALARLTGVRHVNNHLLVTARRRGCPEGGRRSRARTERATRPVGHPARGERPPCDPHRRGAFVVSLRRSRRDRLGRARSRGGRQRADHTAARDGHGLSGPSRTSTCSPAASTRSLIESTPASRSSGPITGSRSRR
jgi:hypothetical protein